MEAMYDWQLLGLDGPTDDLIAIKRAYAVKLRTNRPDDDAAAYQALREAYDRIQQYARWRRAHAEQEIVEPETPAGRTELPPAESAETNDEVSTVASPVANEELPPGAGDEPDLTEPSPTPEALCRQLLQAHAESRRALEQFLPVLRRQLDGLPLTRQAEASVRFADLVLGTSSWPAELLQLLQDHFGWLDDFRSVRLLGAQRAAALHDALAGLERRVTDQTTLRKYAEALAIHALFGKGRNMRALLIAALMGVHLHRQVDSAGPLMLRRMGIGIDSQRHLLNLLNQGQWIRTAGLAMLIFFSGWTLTGSVEGAAWGTIGAAALGFGGLLVLQWLVSMLYVGRRHVVVPVRWTVRWRLYRLGNWWPWVGLALVALAAGVGQLASAATG